VSTMTSDASRCTGAPTKRSGVATPVTDCFGVSPLEKIVCRLNRPQAGRGRGGLLCTHLSRAASGDLKGRGKLSTVRRFGCSGRILWSSNCQVIVGAPNRR
jgi:hypothetical protein